MIKNFDVIVIGSGSGLYISSKAAQMGLEVAVVEEREFGGTCLNRGCIPSKMLIHAADIVEKIKSGSTFGIKAELKKVDWKKLQNWVWSFVDNDSKIIEQGNKSSPNITLFKGRAYFVGDKKLQVGKDTISAQKIFICAGARPYIPAIKGLDNSGYITYEGALRNKSQPKEMIILGGGYIAAELGGIYSSLGTKVTVINRGEVMLKNEDEEISEKFTSIVSKKYKVFLNSDIVEVKKKGKVKTVIFASGGKKLALKTTTLLVATGVTPNTDMLKINNTSIMLDKNCFVATDEYLQTSVAGIWAIGDIVGKYMFKHSANLEAEYCANNAFNPENKRKVDYTAMPHAIFTSPQIASVGFTEQEIKAQKKKYFVSKFPYYKTAMGKALEEKNGFVKFLLAEDQKTILGCHILGPQASNLIHEVVVVMRAGLGADAIKNTVHIHPALCEVVQRALTRPE